MYHAIDHNPRLLFDLKQQPKLADAQPILGRSIRQFLDTAGEVYP